MLAIADTADLDDGPRSKSGTERMCVVTRQVRPVGDLIRFVRAPSGEAVADLKRKLPGRGLWVSLSRDAVTEAAKRGLFAKGFKNAVTNSAALAAETETLLVRAAIEALAMAAKAGQVLSGFAKTEEAIRAGRTAALLHASDGAADGIRKLDAVLRQRTANLTDIPVINDLTGDELDLALGRSNVIHAALLAGPAARTFLARCQTLHRFRHNDAAGAAGQMGADQRSEPNA
ncbi:MAG: RNA-binding protein [Bradyrhizobiaceae bacterium]|nr:MAG: RNA-binding protein [Bradyrhizobiaceae bacterium]